MGLPHFGNIEVRAPGQGGRYVPEHRRQGDEGQHDLRWVNHTHPGRGIRPDGNVPDRHRSEPAECRHRHVQHGLGRWFTRHRRGIGQLHGHQLRDVNTDAHAHADPNTHAHSDGDPNPHDDSHSDGDANTHQHAHADPDDSHGDADADQPANAHPTHIHVGAAYHDAADNHAPRGSHLPAGRGLVRGRRLPTGSGRWHRTRSEAERSARAGSEAGVDLRRLRPDQSVPLDLLIVHRWWQVAAAVAVSLALLGALRTPPDSAAPSLVAPSATTVAVDVTDMFSVAWLSSDTPVQPVVPSPQLQRSTMVPPSQPTRLDIGGPSPIHAVVESFDQLGGADVSLIPPGGNYHDAFFWTRGGTPGDGATHMSYILGHTYSGPTPGIFDDLQFVEPSVTKIHLTTKAGKLRYCVSDRFSVAKAKLSTDARVWDPTSFAQPGDALVLIACRTTMDGRFQTGNNVVVVAVRC